MASARILIVEDEVIVREDLRDQLEAHGYEVAGVAATGRDALAKASETHPDLVLMDIKLHGSMDGIEAARQIRAQLDLPVVFLTAFADKRTVERAKVVYPYGYVIKPFNDRALWATIEVALHRHREEKRPIVSADQERATVLVKGDSFHGLIGKSAAMRAVFEQITKVARVDSTVLIEGETGTGKELVARAIRAASTRRDKPFIALNCAGLTETLAASELFGHRRGAFTGAVNDHKGVFEAAERGTIFLDEIGDVPKSQQPFLLRVLEEREVTRVGETQPRKIDVRVFAATNRSLEGEVAAGRFRPDLFYRVRVARIIAPPLRERAGDVPLLAKAFLSQFRKKNSGTAPGTISGEAMHILTECAWPGNVRELKNAIEFAAIRCAGDVIQPDELPPEILAACSPPAAKLSPEEEKVRLLDALERASGNRAKAARLLGISRATFYRRSRELGLPDKEIEGSAG